MRLKRISINGFNIAVWIAVFMGLSTSDRLAAQVRMPALPPEKAPVVSEVLIQVREGSGRREGLTALARSLILIRENEPFSDAKLENSLAALKLVKLFRDIDAETRKQNQQVVVLFRLTPHRRIKDVRIYGKYPFFKKDFLSVLTVHPGAVYLPEEVDEQLKLIALFYRDQGFVAPKITATSREDSTGGDVLLEINIDRGDFYCVKGIEFNGNRAFSDSTLRRKMKTRKKLFLPWRSGRFVEKNLQKDIQTLTAFYREQRYPEVEINAEIKKDPETHLVFVHITIDEGPRYQISFDGNTALGNRALKKELTLFTEGNGSDRELKRSIRKIKARYRQEGYLDTRVETEKKNEIVNGKDVRRLRFVIEEGSRATIESIDISGNTSLADDEIEKLLLSRVPGLLESGVYIPEKLEEDLDAIKALYLQHGFMDTGVNAEKQWHADNQKVAIQIRITEGTRTRVGSVSISGLTAVSEKTAMDAIRLTEGRPFRSYMLNSDENALSALISEKGYPHVKINGEAAFTPDRSGARVTYHVDEGPRVVTGDIYVGGNMRTRSAILLDEIPLRTGEPFSLKQSVEAQRNIRNLNCIDSARFKTAGLREKADRATLAVEVEEKTPYFIEAGTGYESQKGLYANTKIGDRNLFGANKDAWASGEVSETGYRGDLGLSEPKLWGTRISALFGLFAEEQAGFNQDFGTRSYGSTLGIKRKWRTHFTTGLSFSYENREQFSVDSATPLYRVDFEPRTIFVATPSIRYDTRDSYIRPKKGMLSTLSFDISNGIENQLDDFIRSFYELRLFTTPLERLTFAGIGRARYLSPFNSEGAVSQDQLFFLGGISDVRGYDENLLRFDPAGNAVGGRFALSGSLEARVDLGHNLELAGFFDAGRLSKTRAPYGSDEPRFTVGSGLRYITPIGPIGVLYGHKLNRMQGESAGQWYVSIGYSF
ncbi:MAG: outer membrane protein assembly factor BamA [Pseudomonadota bacterium]